MFHGCISTYESQHESMDESEFQVQYTGFSRDVNRSNNNGGKAKIIIISMLHSWSSRLLNVSLNLFHTTSHIIIERKVQHYQVSIEEWQQNSNIVRIHRDVHSLSNV